MRTRRHSPVSDISRHTESSDAALPLPPPASARTIALFLDLDGSLLDFADHPDAVDVTPAMRRLLLRLHRTLDGAFALLSGRSLAQIDALFDLPDIAAAGLHGIEHHDGSHAARGHLQGEAGSGCIAALVGRARDAAAKLDGVVLEEKGSALALHYRGASHAGAAVNRIAHELLAAAGSGYELQHGNHVVELKPSGGDKGDALATFMGSEPFAGRVPWMIGDDLTDEHAFERANALGGVSVIVGKRRPTAAHYGLREPAAVRAWLAAFVDDADGENDDDA
ncbi:MAG: trehalose-phosphatase [Rhodanobacteraceae bacterium]